MLIPFLADGRTPAVAKLAVNGYGRVTMKLARGSGKMTLPGRVAAYRCADHDLVALDEERRAAREGREALPAAVRRLDDPAPWPMVASDRLVDLVAARVREAA